MSNQATTTPTLPSKNDSWGYLQTLINNGRTEAQAKWAYGRDFQALNQEWDFGPHAIRRILDSPAGRHLADQHTEPGSGSAVATFAKWMESRSFKERILEIVGQDEEDFYGE